MGSEQWAGYNSAPLLKAASKLVSDNTPEARDAAKKLIGHLQSAFEAAASAETSEVSPTCANTSPSIVFDLCQTVVKAAALYSIADIRRVWLVQKTPSHASSW